MGGKISKRALINSFKKIKSHFSEFKVQIAKNTAKLEKLEKKLNQILQNLPKSPQEISSIRNKGVQSINQSLINQSINHINKQSNSHFSPNPKLETLFEQITNKEFLVFLTIFQSQTTTYKQIAAKLSLTLSCVRSYVSELIRKKIPLVKSKLKNRKVILSIPSWFKSLTSEQKLINLYYKNIDPEQTTLI